MTTYGNTAENSDRMRPEKNHHQSLLIRHPFLLFISVRFIFLLGIFILLEEFVCLMEIN